VGLTLVAAAVCSYVAFGMHHQLEAGGLIAFIALSTVTDLREVRLPVIGHVTLSFVPVLAALIVFGLWPAIVVAIGSGLATLTVTRDPQKVAFNVGNYAVSTFVAGLVYLAFLPASPAFVQTVLPAFAATGVDFVVNTVLLAGVIALASGARPWHIWRENYQWGLPSYMTGATLSLLLACLYLWLGVPGLVLGVPPLFLVWYSYDVYAGRMRDRAAFSSEVASFRDELASAVRSQDELRDAQRRVAAEIERARSIQADLLPRRAPDVPGLELAHRIEFMTEMGGDYFDFVALPDGRLGLICGDVMGKGLSAALIMTMARSLIQSAAQDGHRPSEVLSEVNDALTRDLAGQTAPSFLTLAYAIYSPSDRELVVANGGHNPLLVFGPGGPREFDWAACWAYAPISSFPKTGSYSSRATPLLCSPTVLPRPATAAARSSARRDSPRRWPPRRRRQPRRNSKPRGRRSPISGPERRRPTTPPCCSVASCPSRIARIGRYRRR
jgi:Serine phosphatase RsbU, regulator of sigma subunit